MAYNYLNKKNVIEVFKTSRQYTEALTEGFFEYERIARNKPHASIPKEYPKTTDGTTASIIRKTPHRIIQQLPTGKIKSDVDDWLKVVAEFIYTHKIIPNANEGYALLQKCWNVVEKFLTFGFCPTYTPFIDRNGIFCTDLRLPYWGDIFLQPGKISDEDSNFIFMRSWWQTTDLDALIDQQSKVKNTTWNVENLKQVKENATTKEEKAKTPVEREKNVNTKGGVELITGFQRGVGAEFLTFHVNSGLIVRTKKNKDPRGEMPISFAYGDIDGANALGRSVIDLVGSMQNLMDGEMQMYQYNRALQLNPPLIKRGNFSKNRVKFTPNIIIDVGSDPNATVEPLTIDNTALANFPNNYGLMKSQLLNLLASPDTSISAEVGNPGFSKTPQGVEASRANLNIDDNYVRKQFETWFERWSETAINLYFAERTGIEELQLDKESADELRELANEGKFNPELLSDDDKVRIDYDTATPQLHFEVDASTSKMQDEVRELQSLQGLSELIDKSQFFQRLIPPTKQVELWNSIVDNSGTENPEKLKLDQRETQDAIQRMSNDNPSPRENVVTNYKDLPEDIKRQQEQELGFQPSQMNSPTQQQVQIQQQGQDNQAQQQDQQNQMKVQQEYNNQIAQLNPQDQMFIKELEKLGVNSQQIGQALAMLHNGIPVNEIMKMIQMAQQSQEGVQNAT